MRTIKTVKLFLCPDNCNRTKQQQAKAGKRRRGCSGSAQPVSLECRFAPRGFLEYNPSEKRIVCHLFSGRSAVMRREIQSIYQAALALPDAERLKLAERLMESLAPSEDKLGECEFVAELDR